MKKRILTVLLAVCLVVALGTVTAWAENGECYGGEDCDHEASIGNIHYDTLQGAINAAEDMDSDGVVTIDMLSDVTLTGTAVLFDTPGSYILDLGNNTLSSGLAEIIMVKAGDLELTVRNGKMEGTANNTYGIYVYNDKDNNAGYDDVTVIVDGIEMNCGDQALGVQGLNSNNNLIVKNSTIDCETTAIYFPPMSGELIIENSDITGVGNGIVIKGGSLTVRGDSNIKATGESKIQDAPYGGKTEGIGFPQTGATIYVEGGYDAKGSSEPRPIEVNIEGGTFESTQGQSLRIDFTESGGSQTVNITGGTFKNDIENSGAGDAKISGATIEGKVQNTDTGTVSVVNSVVNEIGENVLVYNSTVGDKQEFTTGDSIAIVDGVIYSDLASAISAATDGDTVEIIGDCTLDSSVAITKNITINGNGNTVTAEGAAFYIQADLEYFTVENLTLIGKLGEGKVYGEGNDATSGPWMGIGTYTPYFCGVRDLTLNNVVIDGFSYGLYFASSSSNTNPVSIDADNLVIKNCGIKGAYFEKLTDSTFTNCEFLDNGTDDSKVDSNFQSWMCGVDVNLKYGDYESIVFEDCTFEGNGDNNGTALHIKARDDGANYGADPATLDGVTVTGCTFVGNNATNTDGVSFGPIVIGEPNANNQTPTNVSIQPGVSFTNNLAEGSTYTVAYEGDGINEPTVIVNANSEITLPAPTRNGYTFGGWRGSDGKIYKGDQTVAITSDMTFTAIWNAINIPDTYDIDLIVSDGGEAKTNFSNASAGTTITVTVTPDEGYELDYITVDGERISGTTFKMPDHDVTVRVYFTDGSSTLPFTDVTANQWFYDAVAYVYTNGMMEGDSATTFNPDGQMTRAMFWAVLGRIDGANITGANWIDTARTWAMSEGVSDGTDPNGLVTREMMVTMLWRYAGEPANDYSLSAYTDASSVSDWAAEAMAWAVENGVISGMTATTLAPQGTATRAQCAMIFMRYDAEIA